MNASDNRPDSVSSSMIPVVKPTPEPVMMSISTAISKPGSGSSDENSMDSTSLSTSADTPQNYCAQSMEELTTSCTSVPTCNPGDAPCPKKTFCFPNVVCESPIQLAETSQHNAYEKVQPPTAMPTPLEQNNFVHDVHSATNDPACDYLCLQSVDPSDCDALLENVALYSDTMDNDILPCTGFPSQLNVGDICTATGRCGTELELNNCIQRRANNNKQGNDIYVRVESSRCVEFGFSSGSGVILTSEAGNGGDSEGGRTFTGDGFVTNIQPDNMQPNPNVGFGENTDTAREASWEAWGGEESLDDNGGDGDSLTGWWREENTYSSAAVVVVRWVRINLIALALLFHSCGS